MELVGGHSHLGSAITRVAFVLNTAAVYCGSGSRQRCCTTPRAGHGQRGAVPCQGPHKETPAPHRAEVRHEQHAAGGLHVRHAGQPLIRRRISRCCGPLHHPPPRLRGQQLHGAPGVRARRQERMAGIPNADGEGQALRGQGGVGVGRSRAVRWQVEALRTAPASAQGARPPWAPIRG